MENVLEIKNLKYKDVLKDITFSIKEKTFNILIGPNDSGKTTLVNCIRGLVNYSGNINIFNNNIKQNDHLYKQIGFYIDNEFLLESIIFDEFLRLLKNVGYDDERAKKRIYSIAKKIDITQVLFKVQKDLSSYEKTLVSFAFSIIHDPKLLIIDNDLENLDIKYKKKIFDYLNAQKNLTILFITNNSEYFYNADNLLFLKDGKIILFGNIKEIMEHEKTFIKCGSKLPFNIDLSKKLISYDLLDSVQLDIEKMVNEIWK